MGWPPNGDHPIARHAGQQDATGSRERVPSSPGTVLSRLLEQRHCFGYRTGCGLQAVTLKPNDLLAWTGLSQMYVKDGNIPEAEAAKQNATILSIGGKVDKNAD